MSIGLQQIWAKTEPFQSVLLERRETECAAEMGPGTLYQAERNIG